MNQVNNQQRTDVSMAADVSEGLRKHPKSLPSKYFYDANGDQLFQKIMEMPEYYLTNCELEIFQTYKNEILSSIGNVPFDLIELGAGDGTKTKILLGHFWEQGADFKYVPIDISPNVLELLENDLNVRLPNLKVNAIQGDYFDALEQHESSNKTKNLILFPGANIGNFSIAEAYSFLMKIYQRMNKGDLLLTGFDLKKDPAIILDAYNDKAGHTRDFNLNLLHRINRELGGNFEVDDFMHWETYNPIIGATKSFIVSKKDQEVKIDAIGEAFTFDAWEAIDVEVSQKYSVRNLERMAEKIGFKVEQHFFDEKSYFVDSLWSV